MIDCYWIKDSKGKYVETYGDWYWKKMSDNKYLQVSGKSKWIKLSILDGKYIQVPI